MRWIFVIGFFVVSLFGFEYHIEPKKVAPNVWCFFGKLEPPTKQNGGFMSNSCYIKGEDSFIAIDTGATYTFAKQVYSKMAKIANLPVRYVINTHDHDDHWLGNSFYKERFGAKLIGVELQDKNFKDIKQTRMYKMLSSKQIKGTKVVKLDHYVKNVEHITLSGIKITLVPIGQKAHTPEDIFVYLPDQKILFAGDLVMNGRVTSNRDGSVIGSLKALDMIRAKNWDTLVPGHGYDISKSATDEYMRYFTLLKKRVLEAITNDVDAEEITSVVTMDEFKDMAMYDIVNKRNVFDAYRELEFYDGD